MAPQWQSRQNEHALLKMIHEQSVTCYTPLPGPSGRGAHFGLWSEPPEVQCAPRVASCCHVWGPLGLVWSVVCKSKDYVSSTSGFTTHSKRPSEVFGGRKEKKQKGRKRPGGKGGGKRKALEGGRRRGSWCPGRWQSPEGPGMTGSGMELGGPPSPSQRTQRLLVQGNPVSLPLPACAAASFHKSALACAGRRSSEGQPVSYSSALPASPHGAGKQAPFFAKQISSLEQPPRPAPSCLAHRLIHLSRIKRL